MMAIVPSANGSKNTNSTTEQIHDEFRTIKTFVINQEKDNQSDINNFHQRKERTGNSHQQVQDNTMFEQVYQFQPYRDGIPSSSMTNSTQMRHTEGKPILSAGAAFNNRQRQSIHENFGIQLPLIETNRPRPISRNSTSRKTSEPLGVLPLKRRRNPIISPIALTSEDAKRSLLNLAERSITSQDTYVPIESSSPPKTTPSPLRIRSFSREEEPTTSSLSFHSTSTIEPPKPLTNRMLKGVLSRPLPTPELDSDHHHHQTFRLIIQNGLTKDQTEDFLHYRQFYYSIWGNIVKIFRILEKLMYNYFVPIALINGEKLAELAQIIEIERKPTLDELLNTIINRDEVEKLIKQPGRRFLGINGKDRAAILIQSYWRGFRVRRYYKNLKRRKWAAHVIASSWLLHSKLSKIRKQLELTRHRQLKIFQKKQNELREQWLSISSNRRVVIHIPSLGLAKRIRKKINNLPLRENYQIGCLCELEDPNIDIIYVSPMPINEEILQYYNKLINLRALVEQGNEQTKSLNVNERFVIIVPEALQSFPGHNMCLSTLLKYSPKALKQIKNLIKNRPAYIVTGVSHIDDLSISEYLDIPIYGCEPEVSYLYSTKSGSKRIFKSSEVPIPFGEYDIYNQKHLYESLAQLIIEHIDVQRWLFKIDDYFDGLGIAYCDIANNLPCYRNLLKEAETWTNKSAQKESYIKILSELPDVLDKHTIYINKTQFNSWKNYLKIFLSQGGIIEAYPPSDSVTTITICLSIEPNGHYSVICSGDQLHADSQFSCWGLIFPQSSVDPNQLNTYCSLIVEQCKQRNIYGYIDIDFLAYIDRKTDKQKIWISDLSIGYSEHVGLFRVMKYITTGEFNPQTHSFIVKMKQTKQRLRNWQNGAPEYTITEKNRYAIWSTKLHHKNLSNLHYSIFFQICRSHGVGFDIREKQGSIFTLLECDQHENIGMITISDTLQSTLSNFVCYLNAIHQEITTTDTENQNNFMLAVNDIENILGSTQDNTLNASLNTTTS